MKLVFIGDEFYDKSSTMMSSLMHEGTEQRSDWGSVNQALRDGKTVTIRPANDAELGRAYKRLTELQESFAKRNNGPILEPYPWWWSF